MPRKRAPYIPSKHGRVVRVTMRFDTRNPLHAEIVTYLTRAGVVEAISTRARKLIETGYETRKARQALERGFTADSGGKGTDNDRKMD